MKNLCAIIWNGNIALYFYEIGKMNAGDLDFEIMKVNEAPGAQLFILQDGKLCGAT